MAAVPPALSALSDRSTRRRWWPVVAWSLLLLVLATAVALAAALAWALPQLPPLDKVLHYQPQQPLQVYTADGVELGQFGSERRQFTPIDQVPLLLRQAVLAVEDRRFYQHPGIDARGLLRALWANVSGQPRQGGSTITQQVARNFFLTSRVTPERKLKEALLALRIERQLGKDQILELYLNQIFLGQQAHGFAAAADTYFGKPLAALTLAETALLAGLPQNPSYANPASNPARARLRQQAVLRRMVDQGLITTAQADAARAQVLQLRAPGQVALHGEHVAEMARQAVVDRFGSAVYAQGVKVYTAVRAADQRAAWAALRRGVLAFDASQPWRGVEDTEPLPPPGAPDTERAAAQALKDRRDDQQLRLAIVLQVQDSPPGLQVQTASGQLLQINGDGLRLALPGLAPDAPPGQAIRRGAVLRVAQRSDLHNAPDAPWAVVQWPEAQAAMVALDPQSGRVRALVGSVDFERQPQNLVTQSRRPVGTAFMPFLVSAALDHGVMPATRVSDAPVDGSDTALAGANTVAGTAADAGRTDGGVSVRDGLVRGRSGVSVRLLQHLGLPAALAWAGRFGFDTRQLPRDAGLAVGSGSTTPMQLARAYAVLANGGWRVQPVLVERITDAQGRLLFQAPPARPTIEANRAVPARNVWLTNSLLHDAARTALLAGSGQPLQQPLMRGDLYGLGGSSPDAMDAWYAGFQPGLVAVAWLGNDGVRSPGPPAIAAMRALPIWADFMAQALAKVPEAAPAAPPAGLVAVNGDWRYADWVEAGGPASIGLPSAEAEADANRPPAAVPAWVQPLAPPRVRPVGWQSNLPAGVSAPR